MQVEIENVLAAYKKEVGREEKMLMALLSALAVRSAVRKKTTFEMAQGVYDCIRLDAEENKSSSNPSPLA